MANREIHNVLISGAGIAGPAFAYWLLRAGVRPTIVERAPRPRTGGYMIDFWGAGYDVAERMDLLPALRADGYDMEVVRIVDRDGKTAAGFDADVFRGATGGKFFSILRGDLAHRLYEAVAPRIEAMFDDEITALHDDGESVRVDFAHAAPRSFDAVVGADGLHSHVRTLAFRGEGEQKYLGYYTAAFTTPAYPHRDEGVYVSFAAPGAQIARYALRDGSSAFFFIVADDHETSASLRGLDAQKRALRDRFTGLGWECDEILDALDRTDELYFDAVAQMRLPHWSRGRIALLGDAAFAPSLLAGQGAAFAMCGAYVLADAIATRRNDPEAAFATYESQFKPFIDEKQRAAERFGAWFAPTTRVGMQIRNIATNLLRVPVIGSFIANRTLGDRFVLPEWKH